MNKKLIFGLLLGVAIGGLSYFFIIKEDANDNPVKETPQVTQQENQESGFDKYKYSLDKPGSIWWIVNKKRPLPEGYTPPDLIVPAVKLRLGEDAEQMKISKQVEADLADMFKKAESDGVVLVFGSGFRSYELQKEFYDSYVAQDGQETADRYSARPGTSEHQTGLAFDATSVSENCHLEICFADTPEGKWLKENSYKYGFIIRYPNGKESITGYQYEPWHLRYTGKELSHEINNSNQTLEEYFELN